MTGKCGAHTLHHILDLAERERETKKLSRKKWMKKRKQRKQRTLGNYAQSKSPKNETVYRISVPEKGKTLKARVRWREFHLQIVKRFGLNTAEKRSQRWPWTILNFYQNV